MECNNSKTSDKPCIVTPKLDNPKLNTEAKLLTILLYHVV